MPTLSSYATDFESETECPDYKLQRSERPQVGFNRHSKSNIFRVLPSLCILDGMEGGFDEIAGRKRVNADDIPDQIFSAGKLEKGDTVRSTVIFS